MSSAPLIVKTAEWNTSGNRYMPPKVSDRGSKSISVISTQTNRTLHIQTPLMMTWGISDYTDEKTGESDGKFSISLNFPNPGHEKASTDEFLAKLKAFENQILDDAVKNSEVWFGDELERSVVKHNFFPFLKYSKDKVTKKVDPAKAPAIRAKVPFYNGKWGVEIYDTKNQLIFPSDNEMISPADYIPKMSNVACVLQCGGLWFGGKGWGITWRLIQCVVKPRENVSAFGKCHIELSPEDAELLDRDDNAKPDQPSIVEEPVSTLVEDSDDESDMPTTTPMVEDSPPVVEQTAPVVVKKVVKKVAVPEPETDSSTEPAKKKVVKKKVV